MRFLAFILPKGRKTHLAFVSCIKLIWSDALRWGLVPSKQLSVLTVYTSLLRTSAISTTSPLEFVFSLLLYTLSLSSVSLFFKRGRKVFEPPRYMTVAQAAKQLLEVVQNRREHAEEPGECFQAQLEFAQQASTYTASLFCAGFWFIHFTSLYINFNSICSQQILKAYNCWYGDIFCKEMSIYLWKESLNSWEKDRWDDGMADHRWYNKWDQELTCLTDLLQH